MTPEEAREQFIERWTIARSEPNIYVRLKALDEELLADCTTEYRARGKRLPTPFKTHPEAARKLGDATYKALRSSYEQRAQDMKEMDDRLRKSHTETMAELALVACVHHADTWQLWCECSVMLFPTQTSPETYAKGSAMLGVRSAEKLGCKARLVHVPHDPLRRTFASYRAEVAVESEGDVEILKLKPSLTDREWAQTLLRAQCNLRVFNTFLPYGWEEKMGLDYFGNDVKR
jgi:hypothetical protein